MESNLLGELIQIQRAAKSWTFNENHEDILLFFSFSPGGK